MNSRILIAVLVLLFTVKFEAFAQVQGVPVNFIITKLVNNPQGEKIKLKLELAAETSEGLLTGPAVLSMCNCYCDSIWDAWPTTPSEAIPGTGTMYFISDGDGGVPSGPQTGVLGIDMVEGGIERETEFQVSVKFKLDDN